VGDVVVTSGLGGRFPPGFPVGTITALRPDESRAFLVGDLRPAAQLDRGRDVLLLRSAPVRAPIGPIADDGATATAGAGAGAGDANAPAATPAPVAGTGAAAMTTPAAADDAGAGRVPQTPPGAEP